MTRSTAQPDPQPSRTSVVSGMTAIAVAVVFSVLFSGLPAFAQSANSAAAPPATSQASSAEAASAANTAAQARAKRRAARRRQRLAQEQQAAQQQQPESSQVGPTAAQRTRDAQILAAQKAQSNASARENDALTQKYIESQQRQQAEPRIQDAPGPDSTPLAGDPAVMPAQTPNQASDPPRIQDAPGPAQTLPNPPPATAPTPAPQP